MNKEFYEEMKVNIDRLIADDSLLDKEIICFGQCEATEEMVVYLGKHGFRVKAIIDNNPCKQGLYWHGIQIISPYEMIQQAPKCSIVLIASRAFEAMKAQLQSIGYTGIIYKIVDYNSFSAYSLDEKTIQEKMERVMRGKVFLDQIVVNDSLLYLVCPNNALGDVCMALEYFPEYCKVHQIYSYEIIVVGQGCAEIARMYSQAKIYTLNQRSMDEFVQAAVFYENRQVFIAHHDRPYMLDMTKFIDASHLSFRDIYRAGVYGLNPDVPVHRPKYRKEFANKEIFDEENSVILAPYAKSVVKVDLSFWMSLAELYKAEGKKVFTNIHGDELPVPGTIAVCIPLNEMVDAVQYAGFFVGLRSGLCDVINYANCKKTVVFPDAFYSVTHTKICDFFAMPEWEKIIIP